MDSSDVDNVNPLIVDKLGLPTVGILSILALTSGLWTLYHMFTVGAITITTMTVGYFLLVIGFGIVYGDLWALDSED